MTIDTRIQARFAMRFGALTVAVAIAAIAGCTHVAPYQRGKLAHPSMSMESMETAGEEHVYAVHEGATGGDGAAAGGCGCN